MENYPSWLFKAKGPILLLGETGTGKSTFARFLHEKKNCSTPFVIAHLATLNENIIEGELFGYKKGSFTGAFNNKAGYLEAVKEGTLFLDEISELSLSSQKKLLYLLEEKEFSPLGSYEKKKFRGKIIAATSRNLKKMVLEKSFREDLYYRLAVFCYELEPIRVNQLKKIDLIKSYFEKFKKIYSKERLKLSGDCMSYLTLYDWPGNIREIKNCMEFIVGAANDSSTSLEHLPKWLYHPNKDRVSFFGPEDQEVNFNNARSCFEKRFFEGVLKKYKGQVNKTAREIGVSKTTLIAKIKKYGISRA